MTQGDRRPTRFEKGQRLKASELNGLAEAIEAIVRRMQGQGLLAPLDISGKLDTALAPASSFGTAPSTATMSVWGRDANGDMVDTGRNETVVNRFERISVAADTIVEARWIDGEWRLMAADCA